MLKRLVGYQAGVGEEASGHRRGLVLGQPFSDLTLLRGTKTQSQPARDLAFCCVCLASIEGICTEVFQLVSTYL